MDWQKYGLSDAGQTNRAFEEAADYQVYSSQIIDTENGANFLDHELRMTTGSASKLQDDGDELFHDDSRDPVSWIKANFFLSDQRLLFGTWNGVFTSIVLNVFGVLMFLRAGWMVGNAGILSSTLVILASFLISVISISSGIVLCKKSKLTCESNINGGVFHLLSYALGVRVAVTVGLFYCFGQAVSSSLSLAAFGQSICEMLSLSENLSRILSRAIGALVMLFLLGINLAGVKWIIRLQIVLLVFITASVFDFVIGSFTHTNPELGFVGYSEQNFLSNFFSNYTQGESLFSIYGIFLPSMTGIFSGINMASDLKTPEYSIPVGTYAGVTACTLVYVLFVVIFGCVSVRQFLLTDFLIGEKISAYGGIFMAGLYICSISSSMGSFYGPSRLLQSMARQNFLPKLFDPLKNDHGPSKIPVQALVVISSITLLFILIGQINILAPIVCMPYMLIYGAVNYASFALMFKERKNAAVAVVSLDHAPANYVEAPSVLKKLEETDILLTPSRQGSQDLAATPRSYGSVSGQESTLVSPIEPAKIEEEFVDRPYALDFSSKWLSLFGAILSLVSMLVINWFYALTSLVVCTLIYLNLRVYRPGLPKGVANLDLFNNSVAFLKRLKTKAHDWRTPSGAVYEALNNKSKTKGEFIVVSQLQSINFRLQESQITETNEDYVNRKPYHHYNNQSQQLGDQIFK